MVPGREQRADVAVEDEVRLHRALDRLLDVRIGGVDHAAQLRTELLLPLREAGEVAVDPGV